MTQIQARVRSRGRIEAGGVAGRARHRRIWRGGRRRKLRLLVAGLLVLVASAGTFSPAAAVAQSGTGGVSPLVSLVVNVLTVAGVGGPTPTGSVLLTIDLNTIRSIPLVNGVAQFSTAGLGPGAHTVVAAYSGDASHPAAVSVSTLPATAGVIALSISVNLSAASAPVPAIASPTDGAHYAQDAVVDAVYSCTDPDGATDILACDGPVGSGRPIDTSTPGTYAFAVSATDAEANTATKTVTYVVDAPAGVAGAASSSGPSPSPPVLAPVPSRAAPPTPPAGGSSVPAGAPATAGAPAVRRKPAKPSTRSRPKRRHAGGVAPSGSPPPHPGAARTSGLRLERFDPRSHPATVVGVEVGAFTLLVLAGDGGLALAGLAGAAGGGAARRKETRQGGGGASFDVDYEGVDVVYLGAVAGVAVGDRSRTWRWPGTASFDAALAALPARLAPRSPLLARVTADGTYLRSVLGSLAVSTQIAGLVLGALAVADTGGRALPPATRLTIAIAVLGVIDASAGFVAILTFAAGTVALGGVDSAAALRTLLGLAGLWFVVPLLAGAARPLRRPPPRSSQQRFDRAADFVIASLIGAWAVQKIAVALPGLSGYQLPIASHADEVALWVLGAVALRMLGETAAAHLYPRRLVTVHHGDLREPPAVQRMMAVVLRTAIFVFVAAAVVGLTWQLWVAGVLFMVPQALAVYDERFPKSRTLGRALPEGLLELILMLFLLLGLGALLLDTSSKALIADSFVLLALPGAVLSVLHRFGRSEEEAPGGWPRRIAGTALLAAGVLQVLGLLF